MCNERQTRLVRNNNFFDQTTKCSDIYGFNITSLTDDNTNFMLEHGGFNASCINFGIPSDVTCDVNGKGKPVIEINQVFAGTLSLNKRLQDSITFVGKRVEYKDPDTGNYVRCDTCPTTPQS